MITQQQRLIINRSRQSVTWFLRNYGKIKHPSAGIIPFHPFSYQRKALAAFRKHRLNIFRKCLAEGSMVWTPDGPVPIENIRAGDIIYSYDENQKIVRTNKVLNCWCSGSKETYEVRTKTGHRSYATKDHRYLTDDGWEEIRNITTNRKLIEIYDHVRYGEANEHEAILLGYLLTDGSYSRDLRNDFHFTNTCWRYLLDFQKHFESRFAVRLPIKLHNRKGSNKSTKNSYRIVSNVAEAKDWLRKLGISGDKAAFKKIPKEVFGWDNRYIALLLNRMFAGDGWFSGTHCNEVGIGSESLLMLNQIKQLLSRFQIDSKLYPPNKNSLAKLRIFGTQNFDRFTQKIGIFCKSVRHVPTTNGFFNKRRKGDVKSIKPDVERIIYDIEVENDHNFIVDGAVVHNCRQAGASKIAGAFALWFAMFHNHKTILVVSRRDEDAMGFLREQIVFLYENLPGWMKDLWKPVKQNEHEVTFPNGSRITSLTSHPDVLRSNAASLNIIDEAAFIQGMDSMWAAGWPTLQHGGSVIVISTTAGVGGWYWATMTEAEAGLNMFNPIVINWYDMDWEIEYVDPMSKEHRRIAPRDGIRECVTKEEISRFGPYWSPWLEEQYKALQTKGETWKFEQEILASFIGSGNTILPKEVLAHISLTTKDPVQRVTGLQQFVHPVTGQTEQLDFDFPEKEQGLWIWARPVSAVPERRRGDELVRQGRQAHPYIMGVDTATGKGKDYHAVEVIDMYTREQVAEFMARCLPRDLVKYIDRIGRWYNNALCVVERNNGGDIIIDELRYTMMYPRLWRRKDLNDSPRMGRSRRPRALKVSPYGFSTTQSSKQTLNQYLLNNIREDDDGIAIYSRRLMKQLQVYVRKRDRLGQDTSRTEAEEGHDDLVMAFALALVGAGDSFIADSGDLLPFKFGGDSGPVDSQDDDNSMLEIMSRGGTQILAPITVTADNTPSMDAEQLMAKFAAQLGGLPADSNQQTVVPRKYFL